MVAIHFPVGLGLDTSTFGLLDKNSRWCVLLYYTSKLGFKMQIFALHGIDFPPIMSACICFYFCFEFHALSQAWCEMATGFVPLLLSPALLQFQLAITDRLLSL